MENNKETVVITGATRGIGLALAEAYNQKGYQVYALDIKQHNNLSPDIIFKQIDLRHPESIDKIFTEIKSESGVINILINNAAIAYFNKDIRETSFEDYERLMSVNLKATFFCCKAFIKLHDISQYGRIINIASTRWAQNEPDWELYGASKGGVVSLTSSLAISTANQNMTVNAISPGWIVCDKYEQISSKEHCFHPSGRVGRPQDIVKAAFYLSDKDNDFVNGINLVVDGGVTKKMIYD
ncbi:MAG: SDR family NAD(P)-dependent oxidoreductase [Bacteroidales bacterium]